jgi:hypothetical protein
MHEADAIVTDWYAGEVGGRALFSELARRAAPHAARKWLALARVEELVAARLASALAARQVPIPALEDPDHRARQRCQAVAGKSWPQTMRWLQLIVVAALHEMRIEAAGLPPALEDLGTLVVRHETALLEFAELELAGDATNSLRPIEAFLGAPA